MTSYTPEELAALFRELRADAAAAQCEDAHWYGKEAYQKLLDDKSRTPAAEKVKDSGLER